MSEERRWRKFLFINIVSAVLISFAAFLAENFVPDGEVAIGIGEPVSGSAIRMAIFFLLGGIFLLVLVDTIARYIADISLQIATVHNDATESLNSVREDVHIALRELIVKLGNRSLVSFDTDLESGRIFNVLHDGATGDPDDYVRNVLFDCGSVICILESILQTEVHKESGLNCQLLLEVGARVGSLFGANLVANLQEDKNKIIVAKDRNLHAWLRAWSKYDSKAGWGRFEVNQDRAAWSRDKTITLRHPFLIGQRNDRICDFMSGYLQGLIGEFPNFILGPYGLDKNLVVEHPADIEHCAHVSGDLHAGCIFRIRAGNSR